MIPRAVTEEGDGSFLIFHVRVLYTNGFEHTQKEAENVPITVEDWH